MRCRSIALVMIFFLAGVAHRASAQDTGTAAEAAFDKGHKLMLDGKYAEACAAFEQSQKLDPQIGTRYNIGVCLEKQGKLGSAWTAFREVAQRDSNAGRRKDAAKRADALAPRLTKLLVNSAAAPDGFSVKVNNLDATNLLGLETPVDPGQYTVVATAPGYKDWSATVSATGEGLTVTVAIPALEKKPAETTGPPPPDTGKPAVLVPSTNVEARGEPGSSGGGRKTLGLVVGGGGVAFAIGGVVAGVLARGKWNDAKAVCGGMTVCGSAADTDKANQLGDAATARANIATGLVGAGVVAIGVGIALYLSAHDEAAHGVAVVPSAGPDGASVSLTGSF